MRRASHSHRSIGITWVALCVFGVACSANLGKPDLTTVPSPPSGGQVDQLPARSEPGKGGPSGLSAHLSQLLTNWRESPEAAVTEAIEHGLEIEGDRVKIMIIMIDEDSADAAVAAIPVMGGQVTDRYQTWIDAWVLIDSLGELAEFPGLSQAREPIEVLPLDP